MENTWKKKNTDSLRFHINKDVFRTISLYTVPIKKSSPPLEVLTFYFSLQYRIVVDLYFLTQITKIPFSYQSEKNSLQSKFIKTYI